MYGKRYERTGSRKMFPGYVKEGDADMTKREIIAELHENGHWWADERLSKATLLEYLESVRKAKSMSMEELEAYIKERG